MAEAKKILATFRRYDQNRDGIIDRAEMTEVLTAIDSTWTPERIERLYEALDTDEDGVVEMDEFVDWVFALNDEASRIYLEKPLVMLRLYGFGLRSREDLLEQLKPFGEIEEVYHVKGNSKESLVLYASEEAARKAFEAQNGTFDADRAKADGVLKVRNKAGTPLYNSAEEHFGIDQVIHLTPKICAKEGSKEACPAGFGEKYKSLVEKLERVLGEKYAKWSSNADDVVANGASIREAARQLRLLSLAVQIRDGAKDDAAMWRRSMRLLAKGNIDFESTEKIMDMLDDFENFLAFEPRPPSAAAQRVQKRDAPSGNLWSQASGALGGGLGENAAVRALSVGFS